MLIRVGQQVNFTINGNEFYKQYQISISPKHLHRHNIDTSFTNSSSLFYKVAMSIVLPNKIELTQVYIAVQDGGLGNVDHPRTAPYAQYVICINNEFGITRRASNQAVHHSSLDAH